MSNHVLVASSQDPAGATMVSHLKTHGGFAGNGRSPRHKNVRLHVASGSLLTLEGLDGAYPDATSFIFLSKHKSDSQIPTLTCHCTGNFSDNPYGGNPREIAISYPSLQKSYLKAITAARSRVPEYDIIIEATHHGPTSLKKPVLFVELGSSEKQWADGDAAGVICDTVLAMLDNGIERCGKVGIALGGTHYPIKFNKLLLGSEFGLAAVASKHNLEAIDEQMLDQMIEKSVEKVTHVVVDGKGLGSQKDRIIEMAEKTGLEIHKV
ncbi:MAG TPA: D-aminoacyl-tRNA deacylase [Nitrososphaera sp.]|nr:D-aminoacyl-tRNA deacylase [Nitrososphaera sp.]